MPRFEPRRYDIRQQRAVDEVVRRADEHQIRGIRRQHTLQTPQRVHSCEPAPDHDDLCPLGNHLLSLPSEHYPQQGAAPGKSPRALYRKAYPALSTHQEASIQARFRRHPSSSRSRTITGDGKRQIEDRSSYLRDRPTRVSHTGRSPRRGRVDRCRDQLLPGPRAGAGRRRLRRDARPEGRPRQSHHGKPDRDDRHRPTEESCTGVRLLWSYDGVASVGRGSADRSAIGLAGRRLRWCCWRRRGAGRRATRLCTDCVVRSDRGWAASRALWSARRPGGRLVARCRSTYPLTVLNAGIRTSPRTVGHVSRSP